jgi:hypothetical protein
MEKAQPIPWLIYPGNNLNVVSQLEVEVQRWKCLKSAESLTRLGLEPGIHMDKNFLNQLLDRIFYCIITEV